MISFAEGYIYEIEPVVWGRVGPDPRLQPQVDTARGLGRPGAATRFLNVGDLDCLLRYPNVGTGIRLECRIMLSSDIISDKSANQHRNHSYSMVPCCFHAFCTHFGIEP